jgi:hypothetical protein
MQELHGLLREAGWETPPGLLAAARRLEASLWPEVVSRWSPLTPSGFPVELTLDAPSGGGEQGSERDRLGRPAKAVQRWTTEVAGPEMAEHERLDLVAAHLAGADQPVERRLLQALRVVQTRGALQYGAWLGGRGRAGEPGRYKLYAELPCGVAGACERLPVVLRRAIDRMPRHAAVSMIGIEPARNRVEVYAGLRLHDPEALRPLLRFTGYPSALEALGGCVPGGAGRLAGRHVGVSVAAANGMPLDVTLFVSGRTLFPGSGEMLHRWLPALAQRGRLLPTLVSMRFAAGMDDVGVAVGVTVRRAEGAARDRGRIPHDRLRQPWGETAPQSSVASRS